MDIAWFLGILIIVTSEASVIEKSGNKEIGQRILLRRLQKRSEPRDVVKSVTWNQMLADVLVNKIKIFSFNKAVEPMTVAEEPKENLLTKCVAQVLALYKIFYDKYKTTESDHPKTNENPKEDFEVIEPTVKQSSCDDCVEKTHEEVCPQGQIMNEGVCEDAKPTKLILAIPKQCPRGYRADRLGYCRIMF